MHIQKSSSTVAAELAARSSRDRIARCTFINAVLLTVLGTPLASRQVLAACSMGTLAMWLYFEASSHAYELRAAQALGYQPMPKCGA